jgi:hypothetical protein
MDRPMGGPLGHPLHGPGQRADHRGRARLRPRRARRRGEPRPGRADAYAREHGIERAYGSYEELLADPEVEAIYISLPNSMHVEWTLRACRRRRPGRTIDALYRSADTGSAVSL